ncbi:MAG: WGR domain-containing protein [Spirochaetales bacterium]|nr:WGR domain-containing protein [Spirochaetales bacterium]
MKQTFVYSDEKSNKFWSIEVTGNSFTVTFGRIGTAGQTQKKSFADATACRKEADKLIAEKRKKGYVEQDGESKGSGGGCR